MDTQTSIKTAVEIPSADELYDQIMSDIEPELMLGNVAAAKEAQSADTPEQKKERSERYRRAFEEYDKRLAKYLLTLDSSIRSYVSHVKRSVEIDDRTHEETKLGSIESSLQAL